jgi:ABC-type transporter Mla MlaB component
VPAFRILLEPSGDKTRCRLSGRLDAAAAAEARRVLAGSPAVVAVDVADLQSADESGLQLLLDLRAACTPLEGLSRYLELRLAAACAPARGAGEVERGSRR